MTLAVVSKLCLCAVGRSDRVLTLEGAVSNYGRESITHTASRGPYEYAQGDRVLQCSHSG